MKKEKVYIVLSHKHSLKPRTNGEWQVNETVEFVNSLRNKHYTMASAIGDYVKGEMLFGARVGMDVYQNFENYVRRKYPEQMEELDEKYGQLRIRDHIPEIILDEFGNNRPKTVFDN